MYSAGILPIYVKNETLYFLLGKGTNGEWSDFGGRSELKDNNRWDITACREFYEESIGAIMGYKEIFRKLQNKNNYLKVRSSTLTGAPYYMYVVKIPFEPSYKEKFKSTLSFISYTKNYDTKYLEKIEIQWVSIDTINAVLDGNAHIVNYPLRKVFMNTLSKHIEDIKEFSKRTIFE